MPENEFQFQKIRELGEIVKDSFGFLKEEIGPIAKLIIRYVLPFILLYGGLQVYLQMRVIGPLDLSDTEQLLAEIGPLYMNILLASLFAVFVQSLLVGTYYSYLEAYIAKGKGNFTTEDITDSLFSNTLKALGANIVLYFLVLIGVIMCILPGIYFANSLSPIVMVLLFEKKGLANAFSRTWKLVHTGWGNTFVLNLLGVVLIYAAGFVVSLPASFIGISGQGNSIENYPIAYWILLGLSSVVSALFWIIPYTFLAFQYFNLRERNEELPPEVRG